MTGTKLASELKFYLDYSKWIPEKRRPETWHESVRRVMDMHRNNPKLRKAFSNPRFAQLFDMAEDLYDRQIILGSQRALQFGGDPIMKHNSKMFNCLGSHCDRVAFFQECMYWLLSGCGTGYSVQFRHVEKLPNVAMRKNGKKTFVVPDSIEGWSDAIGVLVSSFFDGGGTFPEYSGCEVKFDFSNIRRKGSYISGGFKAPGHKGLKRSLENMEALLEEVVSRGNRLKPIHCYDLVCFLADAVLSGGVRRSATICLFSHDDEEMLNAKTIDNYNVSIGLNKQRARSNNSIVFLRSEVTIERMRWVFDRIKNWGEPGFYLVDHPDQVCNPCVEIGMWPLTKSGNSGWQGCNLVTANGGKLSTKELFLEACVGMAVLGTIQATYTDFKYVTAETKEIFDGEALMGCSITGWMNNPKILLDEENMRLGAKLILDTNAEIAGILGTNPSARATCVKPEGNTSVLLETTSGCHGDEAPTFFRLIQVNKEHEIAKFLARKAPFMLEESVWSATKSDYVVYIPIHSKPGTIYKRDLVGTNQLEVVKKIQQNWIEHGTNVERCARPFLRHNVSNTVQVDDWDKVCEYLFQNREYFSGVSFLSVLGDKDYKQAPFTSVPSDVEMTDRYGVNYENAGPLIDSASQSFDDLWDACDALMASRDVEWVKQAEEFANEYMDGDLRRLAYCLKDIHVRRKWEYIHERFEPIDIGEADMKPEFVEIDTLGSVACAGGTCELPYVTKSMGGK